MIFLFTNETFLSAEVDFSFSTNYFLSATETFLGKTSPLNLFSPPKSLFGDKLSPQTISPRIIYSNKFIPQNFPRIVFLQRKSFSTNCFVPDKLFKLFLAASENFLHELFLLRVKLSSALIISFTKKLSSEWFLPRQKPSSANFFCAQTISISRVKLPQNYFTKLNFPPHKLPLTLQAYFVDERNFPPRKFSAHAASVFIWK